MESNEHVCRLSARISGEVQGVGFRWFARRRASALRLSGYVRNLPDGSVQVVAEGPRAVLEQFLAALRRGPEGAAVRDVEVSWHAADGSFSGFRITH